MKTNLRQLEQKALKAMMDPHFIFNVINSIQHFINAGDKEQANLYLADFARLIRMCSSFSGKSIVNLEEEVAYLELYMKFEKLRFEENFEFEIIIDPALEVRSTFIAVMMIQPFLENAVWHGILPMGTKGQIAVRIIKHPGEFVKITIVDDGVGIEEKYIDINMLEHPMQSHKSSVAIQRLKLLAHACGHKLYLNYTHVNDKLENKGTMVDFLLPVLFV